MMLVATGQSDGESIRIGDRVQIAGGPYDQFQGLVARLGLNRSSADVEIVIFGRITPVTAEIGRLRRVVNP